MKLPDLEKMIIGCDDMNARKMINTLIDIITEMNKEIETLKKKKSNIDTVYGKHNF